MSCTTCRTGPASELGPQSFEGSCESPPARQNGPDMRSTQGSAHPARTVDGERCASCCLSLPLDQNFELTKLRQKKPSGIQGQPPLRTKEEVHVCSSRDVDGVGGSPVLCPSHQLCEPSEETSSKQPCHSHHLEYVSSGNPPESETFSELRRATIRTLSGEQLPRGQSSGPLLFGDSKSGFTIAYIFRLADIHARGRQRYYALLALAGTNMQRAFEICTVVWVFFEKIATHIVRAAEDLAAELLPKGEPAGQGQITPVSSFLTGRSADPDGFPRSVINVQANGIAELVGNDKFFCELHLTFVAILQSCRGLSNRGSRAALVLAPARSAREGSTSDARDATREREEEVLPAEPLLHAHCAAEELESGEHVTAVGLLPDPLRAKKRCPTYDLPFTQHRRRQLVV